jgi:hypothetical protein
MMNSQEWSLRRADLDAAVAAGVIDAEAAERLIAFAPAAGQPDEENLRLISSFNDIFVTIGLALFLGAAVYIGSTVGAIGNALLIVVASWGLAEIFTAHKRMALPSIVLLLTYAVASFFLTTYILAPDVNFFVLIDKDEVPFAATGAKDFAFMMAASGIATAVLVALHWLRFRVPITVAAGCAALVVAITAIAFRAAPGLFDKHSILVFMPLGLAAFALGMWFDISDRARLTRRTDIAFWLHLLAAPMIVHPVVAELTVGDSTSQTDAGIVIALFVALSFVALIIDRRALLVSSLAYLGYAAYALLSATSWTSSTYALAVLAVGAIVLALSVAWRPLRAALLNIVPMAIRNRVPAPS